MRLSLREAFDLTPTFELKLGPRVYGVPPLTFGRFQEVLRCDYSVVSKALVSFDSTGLSGSPEEIGRKLAYFPTESFLGVAKAVVPGLKDEDWNGHATPFNVFELFLWFGKLHDWPFIGEAINFGKPLEEGEVGPTHTQFAAVLLRLARELGCTIQELLDLRVEGFYLSAEAIKERHKETTEAAEKSKRDEMHGALEQFLPVTRVQPEATSG